MGNVNMHPFCNKPNRFNTLAPGNGVQRYCIWVRLFVCCSVCLFVHAGNSKTIAPIDLSFGRNKYYSHGLVLL